MRRWAIQLWSLKRGLKLSALGAALFLLRIVLKLRVLVRGSRRLKEFVLHLERWSPEVGCFNKGVAPKEVWVWDSCCTSGVERCSKGLGTVVEVLWPWMNTPLSWHGWSGLGSR